MIPKYVIESNYNSYEYYPTQFEYKEIRNWNEHNRTYKGNINDLIDGQTFKRPDKMKNVTLSSKLNIHETDYGVMDLDWDDVWRVNEDKRSDRVLAQGTEVLRIMMKYLPIKTIDIVASSFLYGKEWTGIPKLHLYFKLDGVYDISHFYMNPHMINYCCRGFQRYAIWRAGVITRISKKFDNTKIPLPRLIINANGDPRQDGHLSMFTFDEYGKLKTIKGPNEITNEDDRIALRGWCACNYMDDNFKMFGTGEITKEARDIKLCTLPGVIGEITSRDDSTIHRQFKVALRNCKHLIPLNEQKPMIKQEQHTSEESICLR